MGLFLGLFVSILLCLLVIREWLKRRGSVFRPNQALKRVSRAVAAGDWGLAEAKIEPLLRSKVPGAQVHFLQASILKHKKLYREALDSLKKAMDQEPRNLAFRLEKGRLLLLLRQPADALEALLEARPVFKGTGPFFDLAEAFLAQGEPALAWEEFLPHFNESKANGRELALAGDIQYRLGNFSEAIEFYRAAEKKNACDCKALARMGHGLRRTGRVNEAETCFRNILARDPADVSSLLGLGACFEAKGFYDQALIIYQAGQAWEMGDPRLLRQAGICALHGGRYRFAVMYLQEAWEKGLESPGLLAYLGSALEGQERWLEAIDTYQILIEKYPEHPAGYNGLAWGYAVGHLPELEGQAALDWAHRAYEILGTEDSVALIAACFARLGDFSQAQAIQENLVASSRSKESRQRFRRAIPLFRRGSPPDASTLARPLVA